ncbi:hypothetical protein [Nonomuraea bangladeshensis]|uniref:hypothetical protein n=1 Tax=Nonomuraea bangladeshensis TaxID=404385 RepID=UPI003C2BD9C6
MVKALTKARTLIVGPISISVQADRHMVRVSFAPIRDNQEACCSQFASGRVPDPVVHARASPAAVHQVNHLFDAALTDGEGQALLPDTKLTSEREDAEPRVESVAELGQNGIIRELVT